MNTDLSDLGFTPTSSGGSALSAVGTAPVPATASSSSDLHDLGFTPTSQTGSTGNIPSPAKTGPTGTEGPFAAAGNVLKNFIPSAFNFGKGVISSTESGLEDLGQIPSAIGGLYHATKNNPGGFAGGIVNAVADIPQEAYQSLVPKAVKETLAGNFGQASAEIQSDPFGQIAPLVLIGDVAARKISPEAAKAFQNGVSKIAQPITTAASGLGTAGKNIANFAGNAIRYGVKGATGLDAGTISRVVQSPEQFTPEALAQTTRFSVAQSVKDALDARENNLSESGRQYGPIRQSTTPIQVGPNDLADAIIKTTGLEPTAPTKAAGTGEPIIQFGAQSAAPEGFARSTTGSVLTPGEVNKINAFYQTWQPRFAAGNLTPQEFLNMRSELAGLAKYEGGVGKSTNLENAASRIRGIFNTQYRDQIPGLAELDADQTAQRTELRQLSQGLLDKDGNLRDSDINKIANATGKSRAVLLAQLEELVPGITDKLNALKAIEDIRDTGDRHKVGTYNKALLSGGVTAFGFGTGNIPLIVGGITEAVLSNPNVAVPLLRAYGFSRQLVAGVTANLSSIASAANQLPNGREAAFGALTPRLQAAAESGAGAIRGYFKKNPVSIGLSLKDVSKENPEAFKGFSDITTKILEDLKGRTTISKQYIMDATNRGDIKQAERDSVRRILASEPDTVNVKDFADKLKTELLPLDRSGTNISQSELGDRSALPSRRELSELSDHGLTPTQYEGTVLPPDLRGPIKNYSEHIYQSPIQTSAGDVHFSSKDYPRYFAHVRTEDLPDGKTRRDIEIQSDLFQKGRLEGSIKANDELAGYRASKGIDIGNLAELKAQFKQRISKLEPYRNTWYERIVREEVKQAAKDGKTKLQIPTGETALAIEGIGDEGGLLWETSEGGRVEPRDLKVGESLFHGFDAENEWVITDVIGDGRFKAIPKQNITTQTIEKLRKTGTLEDGGFTRGAEETFDISGKVDTNNPIYRFYEKTLGKYLINTYGAKQTTDPQGVKWWEVPVKKQNATEPVLALSKKREASDLLA